jgi:hypothetical protein
LGFSGFVAQTQLHRCSCLDVLWMEEAASPLSAVVRVWGIDDILGVLFPIVHCLQVHILKPPILGCVYLMCVSALAPIVSAIPSERECVRLYAGSSQAWL